MLYKSFCVAGLAMVVTISGGCCLTSCQTGCATGCGEPCPTADFACVPGGVDPLGYTVPPAAAACNPVGAQCGCSSCQCGPQSSCGSDACAEAACPTCAAPSAVADCAVAPACAAPGCTSDGCAANTCAAPVYSAAASQPAPEAATEEAPAAMAAGGVSPHSVYPPPAEAAPYHAPQSAAGTNDFEHGPAPAQNNQVPAPPQDQFQDPASGDDLSFYRPRVIRSTAGTALTQVRPIQQVSTQSHQQPAVRPDVHSDDDLPVFYLDK